MSSFGLYVLGFVVLLAGIGYGAYLLHVPHTWILVGGLVIIGIGIMSAVTRTKRRDPPSEAPPPSLALQKARRWPADGSAARSAPWLSPPIRRDRAAARWSPAPRVGDAPHAPPRLRRGRTRPRSPWTAG